MRTISLRPCLIAGIVCELITILFIANAKMLDRKAIEDNAVFIGICIYNHEDTFINSLRQEIDSLLKESEYKGIRVRYEVVNAAGSQITQNRQVERFIALEYDAICVNPVERTEVSAIIDKAVAADIPLIFFNREPVKSDINRGKKIYYIGDDSKDAALQQAEIISELYASNPLALDLNGDGNINYVVLEGEANHQAALLRTEWAIKALQNDGIPIHKLAAASANWDRNQASAIMEGWIKKYSDSVELVIANNDDMALGARDAAESCASLRNINIVGIDGSAEALKAVDEGRLCGTVRCDFRQYAEALLELAIDNAANKALREKAPDKNYYIKFSTYKRS